MELKVNLVQYAGVGLLNALNVVMLAVLMDYATIILVQKRGTVKNAKIIRLIGQRFNFVSLFGGLI